MTEKKQGNEEALDRAAREAAEKVLVEFRSLAATSLTIPLQHDDPTPGGIKPGKGTGHTPSDGAEEAVTSGTEDAAKPAPES